MDRLMSIFRSPSRRSSLVVRLDSFDLVMLSAHLEI